MSLSNLPRGLPSRLGAFGNAGVPASGWWPQSGPQSRDARCVAARQLWGGRPSVYARPWVSRTLGGPYACYTRDVHVFPSISDAQSGEYGSSQAAGVLVPPTAVEFGPAGTGRPLLLAMADEDGTVTVVDTAPRTGPREAAASDSAREWWMGHNNAIFDLVWSPDGAKIVTASGDQNCKVWDVETGLALSVLSGHKGSVKSVTVADERGSLLASSARDGAIMMWDVRAGSVGPVVTLPAAHVRPRYRGKRRARKLEVNQSVTGVRFAGRGGDMLLSTGAIDGLLKLWDVRSAGRGVTRALVTSIHPGIGRLGRPVTPGGSESRHGLAALDVSPDGSRVLVSQVAASAIYVYDTLDLVHGAADAADPIPDVLVGHTTRSFYVKSVFARSSDPLVVSGSSDGAVYIWDLRARTPDAASLPSLCIRGHAAEVTAVDTCPVDVFKIASASDDNSVRVWDLAPPADLQAEIASSQVPPFVDIYSPSGAADAADITLPSHLCPIVESTADASPSRHPSLGPQSRPTSSASFELPEQASITQFFGSESRPGPDPPLSPTPPAAQRLTAYFKPLAPDAPKPFLAPDPDLDPDAPTTASRPGTSKPTPVKKQQRSQASFLKSFFTPMLPLPDDDPFAASPSPAASPAASPSDKFRPTPMAHSSTTSRLALSFSPLAMDLESDSEP